MKVEAKAREKYALLCSISYSKCESYSEIDYKIIRAVTLGKLTHIDKESKKHYTYFNRVFVVDKKGNISDIYSSKKYNYKVSERLKWRYDKITLKIVV